MILLLALACTSTTIDPEQEQQGVFSWVLPQDVGTETTAGFFGPEEQDAIFDDIDLAEFALEIDDDDVRKLEREVKGGDHEWVPATMIYKGVRYENIGVRLKGENSFLPFDEKPSLKLKFDKFQDGLRFAGLKELTLNNMSNDYSMMHERVSYKLMREAGIPASRCSHVTLQINGEDYGLYAGLEGVDKRMIARWLSDEGTMFEVWDVDFYDYYVDDFQVEFGEEDRSHIQGSADAMERTSSKQALIALADHMDVDQFVRFFAAESVIGQYDSYPYANPGDDAHIYVDPEIDRLIWLPHGMDETFYSPEKNPMEVNGIIARRCIEVEECKADYTAAVWELQALSEELDQGAYAREVRAQISDLVENDPHRPYGMDYVNYYQSAMIEFIDDRSEDLEVHLGPRPD
ncbi:MAG: spore coat protein CotH [Cognaticolwellia sp.]